MSTLKWGLTAGIAAVALAIDWATKRLVTASPDSFRAHEILPGVWLERSHNSGVAFGLFSGRSTLILVAAGIAIVAILIYLALETRPVLAGVAGGFLIGGSLGNLWDRVARGEVTDFLRLPHWPNFNLADVFIVIGVVLVAVSLFWPARQTEGDEVGEDGASGLGAGGSACAGSEAVADRHG
jgi:signal peptidase II